ncbi:MAG: aminotransferase class V-fold PLP-dependent enzyme [Actinomycetota bacterium]|nr:aminotransferase class V-fold PLP-dependent enzyme [Actinomycetota bacterium]
MSFPGSLSDLPGRHFLFVPGPTNVPERVIRAMARSMEDHRSSGFPDLTKPLFADLRTLFQTEDGQPFIFPATGTGGWEAALVNTCSPGDRLLGVRNGHFGVGFVECAQKHGLQVDTIDVEWGEAVPAEKVEEALQDDTSRSIKGVLIVHNETSTGVTSDVAAVRRAIDAARHPALLYVDGVSSIGSLEFRMDEWGVDLAITGSQKGLMLPAGLGIVCASQRALAAGEGARCARAFFDFKAMQAQNPAGYFPYTPALALLFGLRESLDILLEEGLDNVFARHFRSAEGVREAVRAWGLELCARRPEWASDTVTAVMVPPGFNSANVIDVAFRRYNLSLGAGLTKVAGKLFRIGHMGDVNDLMLLGAIAGVEMSMLDVGISIQAGSGMAAAQSYYRRTAPPLPDKVDRESASLSKPLSVTAAVGAGGRDLAPAEQTD